MNEDNMRTLYIFGEENVKLNEKLSDIPGWRFSNTSDPRRHLLEKDGAQVFLNEIASNIFQTSNILPQDHSTDHPRYGSDLLYSLKEELAKKEIPSVLDISSLDAKKLSS